jgi:hypothetical protein
MPRIGYGAVLRAALQELADAGRRRSHAELYSAYRDSGGARRQPNTIGEWLRDGQEIKAVDLAILVEIINGWRREAGLPILPVILPRADSLMGAATSGELRGRDSNPQPTG